MRTDLYHIIRHLTALEPSNRAYGSSILLHSIMTYLIKMISFKVNFQPGIFKFAQVSVVAGVPIRPSAFCVIRLSHNNVSAVHDSTHSLNCEQMTLLSHLLSLGINKLLHQTHVKSLKRALWWKTRVSSHFSRLGPGSGSGSDALRSKCGSRQVSQLRSYLSYLFWNHHWGDNIKTLENICSNILFITFVIF